MNLSQLAILKDVLCSTDINSSESEYYLIYNYHNIVLRLNEYISIFSGTEEYENVLYVYSLITTKYKELVIRTIKEAIRTLNPGSNYSINYALDEYPYNTLELKISNYIQKSMLPNDFRVMALDTFRDIAARFNKRLIFDELALITLIEASSGYNIARDEGSLKSNRVLALDFRRNDDLHKNDYHLVNSDTFDVYTHNGKRILDPTGKQKASIKHINKNIFISDKKESEMTLKQIMEMMFENLNLCIDIYNTKYLKGNKPLENRVILTNGTTFEFEYELNEKNIYNILGIPKASSLNSHSIESLNNMTKHNASMPGKKYLSTSSSALDVLEVICANQQYIIDAEGLYEFKGIKYQLLNWEKIILGTASFIRSDFFKQCFAIKRLSDTKHIASKDEQGMYASISNTEFSEKIDINRNSDKTLFEFLQNYDKKTDFIFKGFSKNQFGRIVLNSIIAAKSETIRVGLDKEELKTLQRYKDKLFDKNFEDKSKDVFAIASSVENENTMRIYTPIEQAMLAMLIENNLGESPYIGPNVASIISNLEYFREATLNNLNEMYGKQRTNKKIDW